MKICLLTLAIVIVTNAQLLDFHDARTLRVGNGEEHDKVIDHDFIEVDPIVFSGYNTGFSVYYGKIDYIWESDYSIVTKLELFSVVLGDLEDNNYY